MKVSLCILYFAPLVHHCECGGWRSLFILYFAPLVHHCDSEQHWLLSIQETLKVWSIRSPRWLSVSNVLKCFPLSRSFISIYISKSFSISTKKKKKPAECSQVLIGVIWLCVWCWSQRVWSTQSSLWMKQRIWSHTFCVFAVVMVAWFLFILFLGTSRL